MNRRPSRSGNYTGLLALSLPTVLAAGALAIDLSTQKVVRSQLQAVADISALAGTEALDGTEDGLDRARLRATRAAARNRVNGRAVQVQDAEILAGAWRSDLGLLDTEAEVEQMDSLQVSAADGQIPTTLARLLFRREEMGARGASTGFRPPPEGASAVGCYLPIAIPSCLFDRYSEAQLQSLTLVLNPAGLDTMGWGRVGAHPNASFIRDQLRDCEQDGIIEVGDEVGLQNGVVNSALSEIASLLAVSPTTWSPDWGPQPSRMAGSALSASNYGRTLEGAIIVFDGGPGYCQGSGGSFNGFEPLVGFAWAAIFDVRTSGSASQKNVRMKLDTLVDRRIGLRGGGALLAGVAFQSPSRLIR